MGDELPSLPKTWWIHQQSNSLLGYHKNFFAPDYLQTTRAVYSYAKGNRHYYADGMYVKKAGITSLHQRVTENQPTLRSWLIPISNLHCNLQQRHYCSPHLGDLEYTLLRAMYTLKESASLQHSCATYISNFTTIQKIRTDYHQQAKRLFPILNYTIFSYVYSPQPFLHGPLTTYALDTKNLQAQLNDCKNLHNLVWSNVQPRYLKLLKSVFSRPSWFHGVSQINLIG